jgi:hypothetical protein
MIRDSLPVEFQGWRRPPPPGAEDKVAPGVGDGRSPKGPLVSYMMLASALTRVCDARHHRGGAHDNASSLVACFMQCTVRKRGLLHNGGERTT